MKKLLFKIMLLFVAGILFSTNAIGQIMPPIQNSVIVYPLNPTSMDSLYVAYTYTSSDGCPDFTLAKDSVVKNRIYINKKNIDNTNRICTQMFSTFTTKLNIGLFVENSQIYFDGELIKTTPSNCIMDRVGVVIGNKTNLTLVKDSLSDEIYSINNVSIAPDTKIKFKGTKIQCFTTPCYNIVDCYSIITTPPVCLMNKEGIVVGGIEGFSGQLFFQEISPISSYRPLYKIKNELISNTDVVSSVLKIGDKVKFGGYLVKNDTNIMNSWRIVGIATCYELVNTPPVCIMDKQGLVVPGIDGCTGKLFIEDTSFRGMSLVRQLYLINGGVASNNGTTTSTNSLKIGDKVKFGSTLVNNDTAMSVLCPIVGVATCYEPIQLSNLYTLSGTVFAGSDLMKAGYAILFRKGFYKAIASHAVTDGKFLFSNLPKADYSVLVIPNISFYRNYFPTFYSNKLKYRNADYITLNASIDNVVVNLRKFVLPSGNGKIYGNIFFETYSLKDSILSDNGAINTLSTSMNTTAINTPVMLYGSTNEPVAWTMTDVNGNYIFENIALDSYKVVSETASAIAEIPVVLTGNSSVINADLLLKSQPVETGINELESIDFEYYPSQITDKLCVKMKERSKVRIYNSLGKMMLYQSLNSGLNTLDLSQLSSGIYFATIGDNKIKILKK
jgi:hypothetical protein